MKHFLCLLAALALVATAALASDPPTPAGQTCPADRAAEAGANPFGAFHEIMAPAWHEAWPDSNFEALFAAGPKFVEAFKPIAEMKPTFKTKAREQAFSDKRAVLGRLINTYAEAAAAGDKETVYAIMPDLHDAFEMAAATLLPVDYPQFEGVVITLNLILESHLPKNNTEGIVGSTETLLAKLHALTPETLPTELQDKKDDVMADVAAMHDLVVKMNQSCTDNDMATYTNLARSLDAQVKLFIEKYI